MCSGHIVFFLEQHVIKRYFFKQRSGEKTKKPKIAEDGEAYSGGKAVAHVPHPPLAPGVLPPRPVRELEVPREKHSCLRREVRRERNPCILSKCY